MPRARLADRVSHAEQGAVPAQHDDHADLSRERRLVSRGRGDPRWHQGRGGVLENRFDVALVQPPSDLGQVRRRRLQM